MSSDDQTEGVRQLHAPRWARACRRLPPTERDRGRRQWYKYAVCTCADCDDSEYGPLPWPCETAKLVYAPDEITQWATHDDGPVEALRWAW